MSYPRIGAFKSVGQFREHIAALGLDLLSALSLQIRMAPDSDSMKRSTPKPRSATLTAAVAAITAMSPSTML